MGDKMSEHMSIKGKVDYWHIPYREEGFTWCRRCKQFCSNLEVCFHEGWLGDWMEVNCGKCKKAIWACGFKNLPDKFSKWKDDKKNLDKDRNEDIELDGVKLFIRDNKKCAICKKPTNRFDCSACGGNIRHKKTSYWCSRKCNEKGRQIFLKKYKKKDDKQNKNI